MARARKLWKECKLTIMGDERPASEFWAADKNPGVELNDVGVHDQRQVFIWRICKCHLMFQSFKSVIDSFKKGYGTSMNCKVCQQYNNMIDNASIASTYEETAYLAMSHVPGVYNA